MARTTGDGLNQANNEWRNDPERREEWRRELEKRAEVVRRLTKLLDEAESVIRNGPRVWSNGHLANDMIYIEITSAVSRAHYKLFSLGYLIDDQPTETYLGNCAAFGRPGEWQ